MEGCDRKIIENFIILFVIRVVTSSEISFDRWVTDRIIASSQADIRI